MGFDRPGLEFAWREGDANWAVHVLDSADARRLLTSPALAGTPQTAHLQGVRRKAAAGRSIGGIVLAVILAIPILLLIWFVLNAGTIAGWVADRIPLDQEVAAGRQAFAGMRNTLRLKDDGPAYDAVQSIVATLTPGSQYRYEVHVAEDSTINAFAMPGGVIVVHTGLISATTRPEELAGVLAHEVQHVELRHSLRGMIKDLGFAGVWSFVTGDIGATIAGQATRELVSLRFSRDDEREADRRGFDALVAAGIDPSGMPAFFKIVSQKAADMPVTFLSTHPLSEDRERELNERLEMIGRQPFAPLSFAGWPPAP